MAAQIASATVIPRIKDDEGGSGGRLSVGSGSRQWAVPALAAVLWVLGVVTWIATGGSHPGEAATIVMLALIAVSVERIQRRAAD